MSKAAVFDDSQISQTPQPASRTEHPVEPTEQYLNTSHALRSRPFLVYSTGSFFSWVGDWMDLVTLNWAVLQLTGSALHLGLINCCRLIPVFVLSLPAGMLADRIDRRRLLLGLQFTMMVLTFLVGWLVAIRSPFVWFAAIVTVRAIVGAMVLPVRHAFVSNLVPARLLPSAIATQTTIMNIARIAGPALAGVLLVYLNPASVFWVNGCSFILVVWTIYLVRSRTVAKPIHHDTTSLTNEGVLRFIRRNRNIQSLLLLAIVPMIFGFPYTALMPLFARDLLNVGAGGFGLLLSLAAIGALSGSSLLSAGFGKQHVGIWLIGSILGFGGGLILFAVAGHFWLAAGLMFVIGFMSQIYRTMSRIAIQVLSPDHLRGRILSIAMMDRGFIPLGTLMIAAMAEWAGAITAGLFMGAGCVLVTLFIVVCRREICALQFESV